MKTLLCFLLMLASAVHGENDPFERNQEISKFAKEYRIPKEIPALSQEKALTWDEIQTSRREWTGKTVKMKLQMEGDGVEVLPFFRNPEIWEAGAGGPAMLVDRSGMEFFSKFKKSKRQEKVVVIYFDPALAEFPMFVVAVGQHATTGVGGRGVFRW
jgi:hypothetical protein